MARVVGRLVPISEPFGFDGQNAANPFPYWTFEEETVVVFSLLPGESVVCVFSIGQKGGQEEGISTALHVVKCEGSPEPDPEPGPEPDPEPTPNTWEAWTAVKAKALVPADQLSSGSKLSAAMESVIAAMNAGVIKEPRKGRESVRAANRAVLTDKEREAWLPFFEALDKKLDELYGEKRLSTLSQYKEIWTGVAQGLAAVASAVERKSSCPSGKCPLGR